MAGNGGRTVCNNTPEARLAILEEAVSTGATVLVLRTTYGWINRSCGRSLTYYLFSPSSLNRCFPISETCSLDSLPTADSSTSRTLLPQSFSRSPSPIQFTQTRAR